MKGPLGRFTERLLALVGLDFDLDLSSPPFSRIDDTFDLGRRPLPAETELLQHAGITHVVSCLPEGQRAKVAFLEADFHWLFLPVHDGMYEDIAATLPSLFRFADGAQCAPDARLLLHCEVGVSRSATLATALLMKSRRKRFFDAFGDLRTKRAHVLPNIGFASQLQRFEHELFDGPARELSSLARYLCEICNAPIELTVMQSALEQHDYDARAALEAIFGGEIPRVVQGVRS